MPSSLRSAEGAIRFGVHGCATQSCFAKRKRLLTNDNRAQARCIATHLAEAGAVSEHLAFVADGGMVCGVPATPLA